MDASAFADLPGAVTTMADAPASDDTGDTAVPAPLHYGDPLREQRALARGEAVVLLSDRAVIAVSGPDRLTWLDSITSQALSALAAGVSTELLVLDPNGRVEHAAAVLDDGETAWLIADAADAPPLAAWLRRMVFRSQVSVHEHPDLAIVGFESGPEGEGAAKAAVESVVLSGVPLLWRDPWTSVALGGHQYATATAHPGAARHWVETIVEADTVARLAAAVREGRVQAAGMLAAEARRIEAWRPRWAREVDERSIPHEVDWLRTAVHLNKGCYRGQETVAKVHNLGHPPRRLVFLHLDGTPAVPGAAVRIGDQEVGVVTSAAVHFELGPIALAILKRSADPAAALEVDSEDGPIAAAQEVIVPPSAGAEAGVPRLPRLGARR